MTPDEYCQQKAARSGSSFYYSFLFLPQDKRRAITAFYAFCREVDDVVDEISDVGIARAKLDWWRAEVARIGTPEAQHPVALALAPFLLYAGLSPVLGRRRIDMLGARAREALGDLNAHAVDTVQGLAEIVAFRNAGARGRARIAHVIQGRQSF